MVRCLTSRVSSVTLYVSVGVVTGLLLVGLFLFQGTRQSQSRNLQDLRHAMQVQGEQTREYLEHDPDGQSLMEAVSKARFDLEWNQHAPSGEDSGGYLGVSHEQNLKAWFGANGMTLSPTVSNGKRSWHMDMRTQSIWLWSTVGLPSKNCCAAGEGQSHRV